MKEFLGRSNPLPWSQLDELFVESLEVGKAVLLHLCRIATDKKPHKIPFKLHEFLTAVFLA